MIFKRTNLTSEDIAHVFADYNVSDNDLSKEFDALCKYNNLPVDPLNFVHYIEVNGSILTMPNVDIDRCVCAALFEVCSCRFECMLKFIDLLKDDEKYLPCYEELVSKLKDIIDEYKENDAIFID